MSEPFFSIIIPTYNRASFITKTIESALNQNQDSFEVVVVDDGSTDETQEILGGLADKRLRCVFQENKERGAARNRGVRESRGRYVYFLDSDDLLFTNHLSEAYKTLSNEEAEFYFQPYSMHDEKSGKRKDIKMPSGDPGEFLVRHGNFISCHGVFLRRDIALKHPFVEDRAMAGSEDYELWLRLAARYKLHLGKTVTSALIDHQDRSVFNFDPKKLIDRKTLFLERTMADEKIREKWESFFSWLKSGAYSYIALHLPRGKRFNRLRSQYLWKAVLSRPAFIFSKRNIVIIRQLLIGR